MAGVLPESTPSQPLEQRQSEEKLALIDTKTADADYSWLPSWACADWVVQIAEERKASGASATESRLTFFDVAGPATKVTGVAFCITWIFLLSFQIGIFYTSTCETADSDEGHAGKQVVETPSWLFLTYIPVFLMNTFCEWRCFKDVSIPLVQWVGKLKILGVSVPFAVWIIYEFGLTTLADSSRPSQSLFIIQTIRTFHCDGGEDLLRFWKRGEAFLPTGQILGFNSILLVVILAWGLMWMEAVVALLYAVPIEAVNYEPRSMKDGYEVLMSLNPWHSTTFSKKGDHDTAARASFHIWHADALQTLAEPAGMHSIRGHYMKYSLERAQVAAEMDPAKTIRAFQIVGSEATRAVTKVAFQAVQMCCALEVHITLVAFDASRVGGAENLDPYRTVAPMIFHILSALLQLGDASGKFWTLFTFRDKIQSLSGGALESKEDQERAQQNSRTITSALVCFFIGIMVYSCVLIDVGLKLYGPILCKVPLPRSLPHLHGQ